MNANTFNQEYQRVLTKAKELVVGKGIEYATDHDRLHNFRTAARVNNTTMPRALWGMITKHLVSVMDMVEAPPYGPDNLPPTPAKVQEKIVDMIVYLTILSIMLGDLREEYIHGGECDATTHRPSAK